MTCWVTTMTAITTCKGLRRDGSPCQMSAGEADYCWAHDPGRVAERLAARVKGGRASSKTARAARHLPPELVDAQSLLIRLLDEVHQGTTPARSAEVIGALVGRLLDLAHFSHELGEGRQLEERLSALESQLLPVGRGGRRL